MDKPISILGNKTKRLTRRKRTTRRDPKRTEIVPSVQLGNLQTPIFGCPTDASKGDILAELAPPETEMRVSKRDKELLLSRSVRKIKDLPTLEIQNISYTIFDHDELEKMAVFEVKKTDEEGIHTVNDPRAGVVDNNELCATCAMDNLQCPGHYGIIKLNEHIIHPLFRREVIDVLTSVCNSCGGLLLSRDMIYEKGFHRLSGSKRLRAIAEASKKLPCRRAQEIVEREDVTACIPNPIYRTSTKAKETGKIFYSYDGKKGKDNVRTVQEIEDIFEAITDEEAALLGFSEESHPRRFIMKSVPVIPICARAPVVQDGMVLKDDITSMYIDIVKANQNLTKDLSEKERESAIRGLIFSIEHLIDNSDNKYRQGKTKTYLDIKSRIQGKEAIIRSLIQGKRVNYSARTILSPDPNLKFGQIRLPSIWAEYLTQPETVSPSNVTRLTRLFRAGRVTHITPAKGNLAGIRIKVTEKVRKEHTLMNGDLVDRWLQNGDYVVFNRQPTLHKQGMMGYEVVLGKPMTIGLHLSYTPPHNAD